METIENLDRTIGQYLKNAALWAKVIKITLLVVAGGVVSLAQFTDWKDGSPSASQIAGMTASILAMIGGLYALAADKNAPEQLMSARAALQKAKDLEAQLESGRSTYALYEADMRRATNTYLSISLMAQALERMDFIKLSEKDAAGRVLLATQPCLPMALGFETHHQWTVGIYEAVMNKDKNVEELKLVQKLRAIDCEISNARSWPAGAGFLGLAYTNLKEVVIEDANDPAVATVLGAPKDKTHLHDAERYVSMALVPIIVDNDIKPWGIAIATSNAEGHFNLAPEAGVKPIEAVRALAKMVAASISIKRKLENSNKEHKVNFGEEAK